MQELTIEERKKLFLEKLRKQKKDDALHDAYMIQLKQFDSVHIDNDIYKLNIPNY